MPPPISDFDTVSQTPPAALRRGGVTGKGLLGSVVLSVAVLAGVLWWTWEPETVTRLLQMNVGLLALAFGMIGMRVWLSGLRISYLSHGHLSVRAGVRGGLAWDFMCAVTPSAAGGAPLASYFIARDNRIPFGEATALMLFSILTDQIWFAVSIPIVLLLGTQFDIFPDALGTFGGPTVLFLLVGIMAWAMFFAYAMLVRPSLLEAAATWIARRPGLRRFEGRVRRELVAMRQRSGLLRGQPPRFYATAFVLAAGVWLTRIAALIFVVLAAYPFFDAITGTARTAAMLLTGLIVPTPGGAGGIEGLYVLFLGDLMPQELIGATLLIWRLLSYHLFLAFGAILMVSWTRRIHGTRMPSASHTLAKHRANGASKPASKTPPKPLSHDV